MRRTGVRDRLVAATAVVVLLVLGALVTALVRDAQQNSIESREDLRLEQVQQVAASMDTRVGTTLDTIGTLIGQETFELTPRNAADSARLERLSNGQLGLLLVDRTGTVVNGTLLQDPRAVGTRIERLEEVLAGEPALLPTGPGLTSPAQVLRLALPLRSADDHVAGAIVAESPISEDSAFNQEIAQLGTGNSARYSFVDATGTVVAGTDTALLGRMAGSPAADAERGVHRSDGRIVIAADVPSAGWRLVFDQSLDDFEGDVTGPLRRAIALGIAGTALAGTVAVVSLLRRLRSAREEQRRLEEMAEAREEFTSIVSHELRTPVTGLIGFLETALDHWDQMGDAERRQAVQRAFANARTLRSLTFDVLDSTAIDAQALALHPETADLRNIVADAVDLAAGIDADRPISVEAPPDALVVHADPSRLGQVVSNLLENAMRNSPAGSPIDVVVAREDGVARVTVCDHGSGIAPEDRERVFEKFVRGAGTTARGSGLGLYIARNLVEAHGGQIAAVASPTSGAAITFTVPLRAGAEDGAAQGS